MAEVVTKQKSLKEKFDELDMTMYRLDSIGITDLGELDNIVILSNEIENNFKKCMTQSGYTTDDIIRKELENNFSTQYGEDIEVVVKGYTNLKIEVTYNISDTEFIKVIRIAEYNIENKTAELTDEMEVETEIGTAMFLSVSNVYTLDGFMTEIV